MSNNRTIIGWDVEDTVAPFATAAFSCSGSSTIAHDDGAGDITTNTFSFSISATYTRDTFPWTEAGSGFTYTSTSKFCVMRWNPGAGSRMIFPSTGGLPMWTHVFTGMTSGSGGPGISSVC